MFDPQIVRRKLIKLQEYLAELHELKDVPFTRYSTDFYVQRTAERLIQLIVECAVDINTYLLVEYVGVKPPKDYFTSFVEAGKASIVPDELARTLAPSAGMRNVIVHEYEEIDDVIVHQSISLTLEKYKEYVAAVLDFLKTIPQV